MVDYMFSPRHSSLSHPIESIMANIKIGPSFFKNEFSCYSNWHWAWVREILSNSMDCGSDTIKMHIKESGSGTWASVENNGQPMTEEILVNKLLALGESGKNFQNGSVGGFGKAKIIILFCHQSYSIRTGTIEVKGVGGDYEITRDLPYFHGTRTDVFMSGDYVDKLTDNTRTFCEYAQWKGSISLNDEQLKCSLAKGSPRRELSFGTVYTNKSFENRLIVRIGGIPMFHHYTSMDRCVVVELSGTSAQTLTSNRDGLVSTYRHALDAFINELTVDKRKALKVHQPKYHHFAGDKLKIDVEEKLEKCVEKNTSRGRIEVGEVYGGSIMASVETIQSSVFVQSPQSPQQPLSKLLQPRRRSLSFEFIIKNETELKVPDYYRPDHPSFGTYSKKLAKIWGCLLIELHRQYKRSDEFAIGFSFDEEYEALHETTDLFGCVYYINPAIIVSQNYSSSKSFKKRFMLTERDRLISIAAHEFVHGLGYSGHNDEYANKLTEVFALVLRERKKFNWCFK